MSGKTFQLEIITPNKVAFKGDVESFSAPGVVGSFQVLYNHAPLLAAITIGEVKLTDAAGVEAHFATSGGFVEVNHNHVVFLSESIERKEEIDAARAEKAKDRASKRLHEHDKSIDGDRAKNSLSRAQNRLRLVHKN